MIQVQAVTIGRVDGAAPHPGSSARIEVGSAYFLGAYADDEKPVAELPLRLWHIAGSTELILSRAALAGLINDLHGAAAAIDAATAEAAKEAKAKAETV